MAEPLSESLRITVKSPDGDEFLFRRLLAEEAIGRLPRYELEVLAADAELNLGDLLGHVLTVEFEVAGGEKRDFTGHVISSEATGTVEQGRARYRLVLQPWLWFLTRHADCRIFHEKTVVDIVNEICGNYGGTVDVGKLAGKPPKRDYTVQYRESDFDFVSRLLEDEGIYYFFDHTDGEQKLVLCNGPSSHEAAAGYEKVPYVPPTDVAPADRDYVQVWTTAASIVSKGFALRDWNFETPTVDLEVEHEQEPPGARGALFDYPGKYPDTGAGQPIVERRLQEAQAGQTVATGISVARGIAAGRTFELTGFPRADQNKKYLVRSVVHEVFLGDTEGGAGDETAGVYKNTFTAIDSTVQYRPERTTPKPIVRGPQTALVVGSGDIDVDEYGCVLVKFHWDRESHDSCRVRVSHNWAGSNWGGIFIPHVGQEVIIDFLEGDPDRPILTGRVYNEENMPPNSLPADRTKAILRDVSGNEFIMDSKSGAEKIELRDKYGNEIVLDAVAGTIKIFSPTHASEFALGRSIQLFTDSDMKTEVKGNSDSKVTGNQQEAVGGNKEESIIGKHDVKVGADLLQVFGGAKHDTTIGLSSAFIGGAKQETIVGGELTMKKAKSVELVSGTKYILAAQAENNKVAELKQKIGDVKQFFADQKTKLTSLKTQASGKIEAKCTEWKADATKFKARDASSMLCDISGALKEKAASLKVDISGAAKRAGSMIEDKASMIKQKASSIFLG